MFKQLLFQESHEPLKFVTSDIFVRVFYVFIIVTHRNIAHLSEKDEKNAENRTGFELFLRRMKVSEAVCKRDCFF